MYVSLLFFSMKSYKMVCKWFWYFIFLPFKPVGSRFTNLGLVMILSKALQMLDDSKRWEEPRKEKGDLGAAAGFLATGRLCC